MGFYWGSISKFVFSKSGKSHNKIVKFEVALLSICVVKFEVENFEHLL